jgi:hypothetical protein
LATFYEKPLSSHEKVLSGLAIDQIKPDEDIDALKSLTILKIEPRSVSVTWHFSRLVLLIDRLGQFNLGSPCVCGGVQA